MKPIRMTVEEFNDHRTNDTGICVNCYTEREFCEPDAKKFMCGTCERHSVYGIEALIQMNMIEIIGEQKYEMPEPKSKVDLKIEQLRKEWFDKPKKEIED